VQLPEESSPIGPRYDPASHLRFSKVLPRSGRPILVGLPNYPPNTFVATTVRAREPSAVPGVSGGERRGTPHPYIREKGTIADEFTQELELMAVAAGPDRVLMEAERFFRKEWHLGVQIRRLHASPYTLNVDTSTGFLPDASLGWAVNLPLTFLTLGLWLPMWFLWDLFKQGSWREFVQLSAYLEDDGSEVEVVSNNEAWQKEVEDWLARAFSLSEPSRAATSYPALPLRRPLPPVR
jgi:hypothetical protein